MWETKPPDLIDLIGDAVVQAIGSTPRQPHLMEEDREVYISPSEEPLTARTRARSRMRTRAQSMRPSAARPTSSRSRASSNARETWEQPRSTSRSRYSEPIRHHHHHQQHPQRERNSDPATRQRERCKSEPRRRFDTNAGGACVAPTAGEPDLLGMTVEARYNDNMSHASRLSGTTLDHLTLNDPSLARRQYDAMKSVLEREKVGTKRSVYTRSSAEETQTHTSRSRPSTDTEASFTTESRTPVHTIMEEGCDELRDYEAPVNFGGSRPAGSVIPAITRGVHMALTDDHRTHGTNQSDSEVSAINRKVVRNRVEKIVVHPEDTVVEGRKKGPEQFAMDLQASTRVTRQGETPLRRGNPSERAAKSRERIISSMESASELTPHGKKLQKIKRNFSVGAAARHEQRATGPLVLGEANATKAPKTAEQDWRSDLFARPAQEKNGPQLIAAGAAKTASPTSGRSDQSILAHQQMIQDSWQQQQQQTNPLRAADPPLPHYDEFEPSVRAAGSLPSRYGRYTPSEPSYEESKTPVRQQSQAVLPKVVAPREIANHAVSDTVSHLSSLVGGSMISFAEQARKAYDPVKALPSSSPIPEITTAPTKVEEEALLSDEINKVVESLVGKSKTTPDDARARSSTAVAEPDTAPNHDETASKGYRSYFRNLLGMKAPWSNREPKQDPDVLSQNTRTSSDVQAIQSLSHRLQEAEKQTERLQQEVTVLKEALEDTASASQSWWPFSGLDQDRTVATVATSKYPTTKNPSVISEEGSGSSNEGDTGRDANQSWGSCQVLEPVSRLCRYPFAGRNKSSSMFNLNMFDSKEDQNKGKNFRKLKEENSLLRKEMKRMNKNRHGEGRNESEDNSGSMSSSISSYTESLLTKNTFPTQASKTQIESSTSFEATEMTYGPRCADANDSESLFSYTTKPLSVAGSKSSRRSEPTAKYSRNSEHASRRSELASKYSRKSDLVSKTSRRSAQTTKSNRVAEIASRSSRRSEPTPRASRKSVVTPTKPNRIPIVEESWRKTGSSRKTLNPAEEELNLTIRSNQTARSNQTHRSTLSNRSNAVASVASTTRSQLALRGGKTARVPRALLDEARRVRGTDKRSGSGSLKTFRDKINELKYKAMTDGVIQEGTN